MTFLCRLLLAAMLAVLAGGAVAFGPGSQLAHAATVSTSAATSPSGVQVTSDVKHDTSPPLRSLKGVPQVDLTPREQRRHPHAGPELPRGGNSATPGTGSPSVAAMPSTTSNFDGLGDGFVGPSGTFTVTNAPSDSNGAVGPNHYFEIVNNRIGIFNKSGGAIYGPVATNTLFAGFGGLCQTDNDGDGGVVYDQLANRWVVMQFAITGASATVPYLICIAVSTTADPTGSYYRYSFQYTNFPDYPKLGVWSDGYYLTVNQFNASGTVFLGPMVAALDRTRMLIGMSATQQTMTLLATYGSLLPATLDGRTAPPTGSPGYFMDLAANALHLWKFHVDWSNVINTTFTGPTTLSVAAFSEACSGTNCIPQSGTTTQLDSLGDRLMYRLAYRNFGDHESLVTNHSVTAGSSTGVRWYEVRSPGASPTVYQQGTYAPDSSYRWMGSVAMDASGDLAAGFSVSSSTLHPEIHYAGRLATDALGQMPQGEGTIINGAGSQTTWRNGALTRWGDYTSLAVDPSDDCTFWYTDQYLPANGSFNWHTRVGSFKFASCVPPDFSLSISPASHSVVQGGNTSYTVTVSPSATFNGAVQLSASGLPTGAAATFSPNPATSTSTMTVTTSPTTPNGSSIITVTGSSGSLSHTATTTFIVAPPWVATYSVGGTPISWTSGQTQTYSVTITNSGSQTWPAGGGNAVHLGVHFAASGGGTNSNYSTWQTDQRFILPADLAPGASVTLSISVTAPASSGNLVLEYQMVKEDQFWLSQFADVNVSVIQSWAASYGVSGTPTSWTSGQTQTYSVTITNSGSQTWPAGGSNAVHLGVHFAATGGGTNSNYSTWQTDQRFILPADLAPGASVTLTISVTAPASSGSLVLEYQMVKEDQFWFSQFADLNVTVA